MQGSLRSCLAAAALAAVVAACADHFVLQDLAPTLLTRDVWAGGEIRLRVAFSPPAGSYLLIGGDSASITVVDDSTISAVAPQHNGLHDIELRSPDGTAVIDASLRIYGFRDIKPGPAMAGSPLSYTTFSPTPSVLAWGESTLVRVNLRTGLSSPFPKSVASAYCSQGPGPSSLPDVVVLGRYTSPGCVYGLWQLSPTLRLLQDSVPGSSRVGARLSDDFWLTTDSHHACVISRTARSTTCRAHESPYGVLFSPRGDRVLLYYAWSRSGGQPIYSTTTGDTAFVVPGAWWSGGGSFTAEGDTLFMAVGISDTSYRLLALNANSGQQLAAQTLDVDPDDVLSDPQSANVFVYGWTRDSVAAHAHLRVFDRSSLKLVGRIEVPGSCTDVASCAALSYFNHNRFVLDPVYRVLYVVGDVFYGFGQPTVIARFDLMP